jgi:para-nitrobenzyl esterase
MNVWALLQSPLAAGRFQKAICLSGFPLSQPLDAAEKLARSLAAKLLVADQRIASEEEFDAWLATSGGDALRTYLYGKSAVEILAAAQSVPPAMHIRDGTVLPAAESDGPGLGIASEIPLLLGTTRDEAGLLVILPFTRLTQTGLWDRINSGRSDLRTSDFFAWPRYSAYKSATSLADLYLQRKVDHVADDAAVRQAPVWRYEFDWNESPQPWDRVLGAYHGLDLAFLFGTFLPDTPNFMRFAWTQQNEASREKLHRQMVASFKAFLEAGDPNPPGGLPAWKAWSSSGSRIRWLWR